VQIHPRSLRSRHRQFLLWLVAVAVAALAIPGAGLPAQASDANGVAVGASTTAVSTKAGSSTEVSSPRRTGLRTVSYAGLSVRVPASWPIIDLARTPKACVRVDRHAVYLGTPAVDQNCPARILGHTEALLLAPAATAERIGGRSGATVSAIGTAPAMTTTARQSGQFAQSFAAAHVTALASFGTHPETMQSILASVTKVSAYSPPRAALRPAGLTDPVDYPKASTSTHYVGIGFDTCATPSSNAMKSWLVSPFRSIGVYIGGRNRACLWGNLSSTWVSTVAAMGWRLQPIYVGLQPSCANQSGMTDISRDSTTARSQGRSEGADAVSQGRALGLYPGSTLYSDIEGYNTYDATCVASTMAYLDGFVRALHDQGYLAGVYSSAYSAILNLAQRYASPTQARPDVVWTARWDGVATTAERVLDSTQWAYQARAKQYRGDHTDVYGGVSIRVDTDYLDAMVASVAYSFHTLTAVNVRTAPTTATRLVRTIAPGTLVRILCQASGTTYSGDAVWNKLTDGTWISDRNVTTSSARGWSAPLPRCTWVYQHWRSRMAVRASPSTSGRVVGIRSRGSLTHTVCQRLGSKVGDSSVWDKLQNGVWAADYNLANGLNTWNPSIPRCL
jgi:Rv2525c-like, glycoside hydrolase-like domain